MMSFYLQFSYQRVSAAITVIFRDVIITTIQWYKCG